MRKWIVSLLVAVTLIVSLMPIFAVEAVASEEQWLWPVASCRIISSNFGWRDLNGDGVFDNQHKGIDISQSGIFGKEVRASKSGTIYSYCDRYGDNETFSADDMTSYGNYVIVKHDDGTYAIYAHMRNEIVKKSGKVDQGDVIGYVGNSGSSSGAHLHFQIFTNPSSLGTSSLNTMPTNSEIKVNNIATYSLPSGWPSKKITYIFEVPTNSVISQTYPTYGIIEATASTSAMSMPCSTATNPASSYLQSIGEGSLLTATELILNSAGNYWYKVQLDGYDEAYVPSSKMEFSWSEDDDVSISGVSAPQSLTEGSRFSIKGTITSTYNQLSHVSAYVYRGNTTSGTPVTGGSDTVSGNSYSLLNSDVDMDVLFNELTPGTYTYVVRAGYMGYYASSETTRGNYSSEIILHSNTFQVTGSGGSSSSTYTVSFHANGGSGAPGSITVNRNETVTIPDQFPTRWGYTFRGWSESPTGTLDYLRGDSVDATGNVTLYAVWEDISVTVGDGHGFNQIVEFPGQGVWATFVPEYSGVYVIEGRSTADTKAVLYDSDGNVLEENDDYNGGNQFRIEQRLTAGETYHVFARFFSSNETGYLSWGIARYCTITYDNHDVCANTQSTYAVDSTVTLPSTPPSAVGYNFQFWEDFNNGRRYWPGDTVLLTDDLCLTSIWQTDTVTFAASTMDFAPINSAGLGWYVTLRPQASGRYGIFGIGDEDTVGTLYDVNGRVIKSDDDSGGNNQFLLACDLNAGETYYLYVRYYDTSKTGSIYYQIGKEGTVTYDANGGSGAPAMQTIYLGQMVQLSTVIPVRSGFSFVGWSLDRIYAGQSLYQPGDAVQPGETIVLYAVWDHECSYVLQSTTPATCSTAGRNYYECSLCGIGRVEELPATGVHTDADGDWEYNSTQHYHRCDCGASFDYTSHRFTSVCDTSCNTCGYTRTVTHVYANDCDPNCNVCGYTRTTSHSWNGGTVTKQPTCAETGVKTYTCTVCGGKKTESVPKTDDHSFASWGSLGDEHIRCCFVCGLEETGAHSWDSGTVTKQPTCKEEGVKKYHCTVCNCPKTESIPKLSTHTYDNACDTDCNVCGRTRATTHSWNSGTVTKNPTCADNGVKTYACTVCRETKTETLSKTSHRYESDWSMNQDEHWYACSVCGHEKNLESHTPGAAATETTPQTCTTCGYVIQAALGHTHRYGELWESNSSKHWHVCDCGKKADEAAHNWNSGEVTTAPSCLQSGVKTYHCTVCGATKTEMITATGHTYTTKITAPTCTTQGYTTYTCSGCADSYKADYVAMTDHQEIVDTAVAPSCTVSGMSAGKHCVVCQTVLVAQEVLPATGHGDLDMNFVCDVCGEYLCAEHVEEVIPGIAATCEQPGLLDGKKCANCGEILVTQETIPALGHSYGQWTEVKAPTTEGMGLEERVCASCGNKEQRELAKLEPQPTEPKPTEPQPTEPVLTAPNPTEPQQTVPATAGADAEKPQDDSNVITILIAAVAALGGIVIGGIVVLVVLKKKK